MSSRPRSLLALVAGALLAATAHGAPAPQSRSDREAPGQPVVSGLGARGPQRYSASVPQVDSVMARDAALALYDASSGEDDLDEAGPARRRGRTAMDLARFDGPSIGYATIAALTLGAALMRVRRGKQDADAASALEPIGVIMARVSARPAAKRPPRG
jgi:hypothetical protein